MGKGLVVCLIVSLALCACGNKNENTHDYKTEKEKKAEVVENEFGEINSVDDYIKTGNVNNEENNISEKAKLASVVNEFNFSDYAYDKNPFRLVHEIKNLNSSYEPFYIEGVLDSEKLTMNEVSEIKEKDGSSYDRDIEYALKRPVVSNNGDFRIKVYSNEMNPDFLMTLDSTGMVDVEVNLTDYYKTIKLGNNKEYKVEDLLKESCKDDIKELFTEFEDHGSMGYMAKLGFDGKDTDGRYTLYLEAEFPNSLNANKSKLIYHALYSRLGEDIIKYASGEDVEDTRKKEIDEIYAKANDTFDDELLHLYNKDKEINLKYLVDLDIYDLLDELVNLGVNEFQYGTGDEKQKFSNLDEFIKYFDTKLEEDLDKHTLIFSGLDNKTDITVYYYPNKKININYSPRLSTKKADKRDYTLTSDRLEIKSGNSKELIKKLNLDSYKKDEDDYYTFYKKEFGIYEITIKFSKKHNSLYSIGIEKKLK